MRPKLTTGVLKRMRDAIDALAKAAEAESPRQRRIARKRAKREAAPGVLAVPVAHLDMPFAI